MREMNHRAKNMLSVVDAIAHQTATRSPEDFVNRFSERIQALSANQDLLLRTEWKGVDIKGLVHAQLAHFADLIGSRISADGPALRLKSASAQAVGLALHELATNAGKYGALSTETGRVDIGWQAGGGVFTMSWSESGGPPERHDVRIPHKPRYSYDRECYPLDRNGDEVLLRIRVRWSRRGRETHLDFDTIIFRKAE